MMTKHLLASLFGLTLLAGSLCAEPPKKASEEKKRLVLPPFPDGDPELPLLPPPAKTAPVAETAPMPRLVDSDKSFEVIVVAAPDGETIGKGGIAVGFFNHSDRDLLLEIGERTIKLDSRHYIQIKAGREFNWSEKNGPTQTTKVPDDAGGVEIVFRR